MPHLRRNPQQNILTLIRIVSVTFVQRFSFWWRGRRGEGVERAGISVAGGWGERPWALRRRSSWLRRQYWGGGWEREQQFWAQNRRGKRQWRYQGTIRPGVT